jgi:autotransporter adhesin
MARKVYVDTRICYREDTLENWQTNNPVLERGEPSVVRDPINANEWFKVGDGVTAWNDLPWKEAPAGDISEANYIYNNKKINDENNIVGYKGYHMISSEPSTDGKSISIELRDSNLEEKAIDKYAVNDLVNIEANTHLYQKQKITAITTNSNGNTVVTLVEVDSGTISFELEPEDELENWIYVPGKYFGEPIPQFSHGVVSGIDTVAAGYAAFAGGRDNKTYGNYGFTIGRKNIAAYLGVATGLETKALAIGSKAHGRWTEATGENSVSLGQSSKAKGHTSLATGLATEANNVGATSLGSGTKANGKSTIASGSGTSADGDNSLSGGSNTKAIGKNAVSLGDGTKAEGNNALSGGDGAVAKGNNALAFGGPDFMATRPQAKGNDSVALGRGTIAGVDGETGANAIATGQTTEASGNNALSLGNYTKAKGENSVASGEKTEAIEKNAASFGQQTIAKGYCSFIAGRVSNVSGIASSLFGESCDITGRALFAAGQGIVMKHTNPNKSLVGHAALGKYNQCKDNTVLEIGNGTSDTDRNNAFEVYEDGSAKIDNCLILTDKTTGQDYKVYIDNGQLKLEAC